MRLFENLRRSYAALCILAISLCFLYVWMRLVSDLMNGGDAWKQGDWLINSQYHQVRRSLSGDLIIMASDILHVSPLLTTVLTQSFFLLFLAITVAVINFKNCRNPLILILLVSPAFFPFFWAADPQGSMRKEILVYSSFSFLLFLSYHERLRFALLPVSVFLFGVAALSHEGMIFFAPVYIFFILILMDSNRLKKPTAYLSIIVVITVSAAATALAFSGHSIEDHLIVCRPLVERGLAENICGGAIRFLETDIEQDSSVIATSFSISNLRDLGLAYALSFASIAFSLWHSNASRRLYAVIIAIGAAFLPLYFLGDDWGRWLDFHFTSVVFLIAIMLSTKKLRFEREVNMDYVLALSFFGLFWGVGHVEPFFREHGLPMEAYRALSDALEP